MVFIAFPLNYAAKGIEVRTAKPGHSRVCSCSYSCFAKALREAEQFCGSKHDLPTSTSLLILPAKECDESLVLNCASLYSIYIALNSMNYYLNFLNIPKIYVGALIAFLRSFYPYL
uniref:Uncharacterized protein n=1 Tax=Glossina austeni TaxID=7395 RepID=A0A1A9VP48_GLOAU